MQQGCASQGGFPEERHFQIGTGGWPCKQPSTAGICQTCALLSCETHTCVSSLEITREIVHLQGTLRGWFYCAGHCQYRLCASAFELKGCLHL